MTTEFSESAESRRRNPVNQQSHDDGTHSISRVMSTASCSGLITTRDATHHIILLESSIRLQITNLEQYQAAVKDIGAVLGGYCRILRHMKRVL